MNDGGNLADDKSNRASGPHVKGQNDKKRDMHEDGIMSKYEFVERLQIGDYAASNFSNSIEEERLLELSARSRRQRYW